MDTLAIRNEYEYLFELDGKKYCLVLTIKTLQEMEVYTTTTIWIKIKPSSSMIQPDWVLSFYWTAQRQLEVTSSSIVQILLSLSFWGRPITTNFKRKEGECRKVPTLL